MSQFSIRDLAMPSVLKAMHAETGVTEDSSQSTRGKHIPCGWFTSYDPIEATGPYLGQVAIAYRPNLKALDFIISVKPGAIGKYYGTDKTGYRLWDGQRTFTDNVRVQNPPANMEPVAIFTEWLRLHKSNKVANEDGTESIQPEPLIWTEDEKKGSKTFSLCDGVNLWVVIQYYSKRQDAVKAKSSVMSVQSIMAAVESATVYKDRDSVNDALTAYLESSGLSERIVKSVSVSKTVNEFTIGQQ